MDIRINKSLFYAVWLALIAIPFITFALNTDLNAVISNKVLLLNSLQRVSGMMAFTLIFAQIVLGSFMDRWVQIFGAFAYRLHVLEGLTAYFFILIHPLFQLLITYEISATISEVVRSLIPSLASSQEVYLTLGKTGFLIATVTFLAGYFRTYPLLRRNWRILHMLNYLLFYFIFFHSGGVGSDVANLPFSLFRWSAFFGISVLIFYRFVFRSLILAKQLKKE
jgi:predicted ferric reductase